MFFFCVLYVSIHLTYYTKENYPKQGEKMSDTNWNFQDTHNLDNALSGTTLANLKKQRAQSRSSTTSENGSLIGGSTIASNLIGGHGQPIMELTDQPPKITKFSGVTSDVVSDSTRSRRCCTVMWISKIERVLWTWTCL